MFSTRPAPLVQTALVSPCRQTRSGGPVGRWVTWLIVQYRTLRQRARERDQLINSDHRLRLDLVASGQDIDQEVAKSLWRG